MWHRFYMKKSMMKNDRYVRFRAAMGDMTCLMSALGSTSVFDFMTNLDEAQAMGAHRTNGKLLQGENMLYADLSTHSDPVLSSCNPQC
jgi:hypothetical protein